MELQGNVNHQSHDSTHSYKQEKYMEDPNPSCPVFCFWSTREEFTLIMCVNAAASSSFFFIKG